MYTKHTPGPWVIEKHDSWDKEIRILANTANYKQCGFVSVDNDDLCHGEESEANATLIASAPDLLEALEALLKLHTRKMAAPTKDYSDQLEKAPEFARSAIAKARGEEGK